MSQKSTLKDKAGIRGEFVDDRRPSWFKRLIKSRKSVDPEEEFLEQKEGVSGKKKLRKFSSKRNSIDMKGNHRLIGN